MASVASVASVRLKPDATGVPVVSVVSGFSRTFENVACRGCSGPVCVRSNEAIAAASGPLRRTTPMPPRPGGVAIATMVSSVENMPVHGVQRVQRVQGVGVPNPNLLNPLNLLNPVNLLLRNYDRLQERVANTLR